MRRFIVAVLGLLWLAAVAACADGPVLKAGDRMVFLGDSITQQRIHTRYVMDFVTMRNPGVKITFRSAGWSGDTAQGSNWRLERDVLSLKPTVVSICLGMNDGTHIADAFPASMRKIVERLKAAGVRVVLLTPGCVDPDKKPSFATYNETLAKLAQNVKDLAAEQSLPVFDIQALMLEVQTKAKADDPNFTMIPDGVHPSQPGQAIMAYGLIKALGYPDGASGLEIDSTSSAAKPDRCAIKALRISPDSITFTRTDEALPGFLDAEVAPIAKYAPFLEALNAYPFRVSGLRAGTWKLVVQGQDVGTFTADQLAAGVDLATLPGPWVKMASEVNRLSGEQETLYYGRWRNIQLGSLPDEAKPEIDALIKKLDQIIDKREAERIKAGKDRTWKWALTFVQ